LADDQPASQELFEDLPLADPLAVKRMRLSEVQIDAVNFHGAVQRRFAMVPEVACLTRSRSEAQARSGVPRRTACAFGCGFNDEHDSRPHSRAILPAPLRLVQAVQADQLVQSAAGAPRASCDLELLSLEDSAPSSPSRDRAYAFPSVLE